ncbi:MAG TPA: LytTR family DNA-binding domain-containing protein [Bacteroidales bacterium]|nr:LytTR family DNA-binding domain-containing protein [Bacteroidales bacterium]
MEKYSALIVEDVKETSDYICRRVSLLCPSIKKIDQALTLSEAEDLIESNRYDIVFLDIRMQAGTSFDLLKRLSDKGVINFEIIFITGESDKEHILRAIKYSAIDFLYKPLDDGELVMAVNRALDKRESQDLNNQVKLLLQRMDERSTVKPDKITVHLHSGILQMISVNELKYIEADGVVSKVHLKNGETITVNRNLGYYKDLLILEHDFVPLSNSILLNREYIKRYNHQTLKITLTDNAELPVSRRRGKELKEMLGERQGLSGMISTFMSIYGNNKKR